MLCSRLVYMFKELISARANTIIKKLCKAQSLFLIRILKPTDISYFYQKTLCNINSGSGKELVSKGLWWKGWIVSNIDHSILKQIKPFLSMTKELKLLSRVQLQGGVDFALDKFQHPFHIIRFHFLRVWSKTDHRF